MIPHFETSWRYLKIIFTRIHPHDIPWYSHYIITWWLIPLSKWFITPVINGISRVKPLITGVITHLLSGMSHQVSICLMSTLTRGVTQIVTIYNNRTLGDHQRFSVGFFLPKWVARGGTRKSEVIGFGVCLGGAHLQIHIIQIAGQYVLWIVLGKLMWGYRFRGFGSRQTLRCVSLECIWKRGRVHKARHMWHMWHMWHMCIRVFYLYVVY